MKLCISPGFGFESYNFKVAKLFSELKLTKNKAILYTKFTCKINCWLFCNDVIIWHISCLLLLDKQYSLVKTKKKTILIFLKHKNKF